MLSNSITLLLSAIDVGGAVGIAIATLVMRHIGQYLLEKLNLLKPLLIK